MTRELTSIAMITAALSVTGVATAAELNEDRFYVGGGVSSNDLDGEQATGYQLFGGYELPGDIGRADTAIEAGFWDSGDFDAGPPGSGRETDAEGLWINGLLSLPLNARVDLIGHAGVDFGDDDGLMAGGGVGFDLTEELDLRGEYVARDDTESLQANVVYSF